MCMRERECMCVCVFVCGVRGFSESNNVYGNIAPSLSWRKLTLKVHLDGINILLFTFRPILVKKEKSNFYVYMG